MNEPISPVMRARQQHQQTMRRALLDTASRLLAEEGPQALTMRRIAAEAGCSTTVLYTTFGSKDGLADALYREGFERFGYRLTQAAATVDPPDDPIAMAIALGEAYRAHALADRNYYGVMFQQAIPGFTPSEASLQVADATLDLVVETARTAMAAGVMAASSPEEVAEVLWAAAHGAVSLELGGYFANPEVAAERYRTLTRAALTAFLVDPASSRQTARRGSPAGREQQE